ncbi:MAG: leucine--tRNA ligase, partial [Candidatus Gracilibacteria bacterium]
MKKYDPGKIERKWQDIWEKNNTYVALDKSRKEKKYILIEFPYPSGEGLHMGHLRPYVAGDVYSRLLRMKGYEVMYPIGWDAFGLPAENFAIKKGIQPSISTAKNIANAKVQLKSWGMGFDWSREVNTTDPNYYKWTQWIFLKLFKAGLAYEAKGLINWCPSCKTGLANEEVVGGICERCGTTIEKKELRQWYLKITAYAEKLLQGLKTLEWENKIKIQQENWIGRSEGAEITFQISNLKSQKLGEMKVFTTRPDTLFGAMYMVIAPEHEIILKLKSQISNLKEVEEYIITTKNKSEEERIENKEKTGVELKGIKAINPVNNEEVPIFVADYILSGYGTGAIMAVPAHDERDFEFAKKFNLPIKIVISDGKISEPLQDAYIGDGMLVNSKKFNKLSVEEAKEKIIEFVKGKKQIQYHLRDWVFSRQRYWGEPIPLIHCEKCGIIPVPEEELPVTLPEVEKYEPTGMGESPLATIESWVNTRCPKCGGPGKRETNTMPQWAGSSWYYLRYTDPKNEKEFAGKELLKHWLPVDVYFGGMEHTTLHLLYSRFWHEFLYDQKLVPTPEPYAQRIPHGIILGSDGEKMSKSRGNIANPDMIVKEFGADALRMYELFLGPHEATVSWNERGILGVSRFLERVYKLFQSKENEGEEDGTVKGVVHETIKKVSEDIKAFKFNTVVSALMILLNQIENKKINKETKEIFLKLLAPLAPHITEELWYELGNENSIHTSTWPTFDATLVEKELFMIMVQVNGKVRGQIEVSKNITKEEAEHLALNNEKVKVYTEGKTIK